MSNVLFKTYMASLPAAAVPPARTDVLLMQQGGVPSLVQFSDLISSVPLFKDATAATVNVDISTYTDVTIIKTDASANPVTISDSSGKTILRLASLDLTNQDESIRLILNGANWYKVN